MHRSVGRSGIYRHNEYITPIPPVQWGNDRQNSIDFGRISTFGTIDAPVVVRPLTISNKASVKEGIAPLMPNGTAPTSELATQQTATVINPSFEKKIIFLGLRKKNIAAPTIKAPAMVSPNTKNTIPFAENHRRDKRQQ